jgi:hypothetical protein
LKLKRRGLACRNGAIDAYSFGFVLVLFWGRFLRRKIGVVGEKLEVPPDA